MSPHSYDEVVTHARYRRMAVTNECSVGLITLDNGLDPRKPNTFGSVGLDNLDRAIDQAQTDTAVGAINAVALTGKPFNFCAGADLKAFRAMTSRDEVLHIARRGHAVFRRLGELDVASFAFINGLALGGGLEVALHCTYRTVSTGPGLVALPEVFLGLIPGWGGTYLLPNIVGPTAAVTVIIENPLNNNRMLKPKVAAQLGIVDRVLDSADFLEQSLRWAADVVAGAVDVPRVAIDRDKEWDRALAHGRSVADARTHGVPPSPLRALELLQVARNATRDEAFDAEDEALADMAMSPELSDSLYAFDLVQRRAKRPPGMPDASLARPITSVGVVGAGLMASQLALLFAQGLKVPVHMVDVDDARAMRGLSFVTQEIDRLHQAKRVSGDTANRLNALVTAGTSQDALSQCDLVIEAVFEDLALKQRIFQDLEGIVRDDCVLATNTSSLSIDSMASGLKHPQRLVGMHFFNPVALMPLVEVIRSMSTDDATVSTTFATIKSLKKSGVLVNDSPGFVVNRLLARLLGEVSAAVDEGTPIEVADQALQPLGLPMTPFTLLGLVGPAVALHVAQVMHDAFPDRFQVSTNLSRVVAAGKASFYVYDDGEPHVDPAVVSLLAVGDEPSTSEQVLTRVLASLAGEIDLMLAEGVVAQAADIDLCLILGAGWPFWLGGITPYLDRTGVAQSVIGRRFEAVG